MMIIVRAYLKKDTKTIKITRDDDYNVSLEFKYDHEKYFYHVGRINETLEDRITYYINNGYVLLSIYA